MGMERFGETTNFGVYIPTYPGDFYLSIILVRSIQHVSPGIPIMIPEGFDRDHHPFNVPIISAPTGSFWPEIGHQERKFWCFAGPFDTFLYFDADTVPDHSIHWRIAFPGKKRSPFLYNRGLMSRTGAKSSRLPRI
jgi:hypothetical protein